MSKTNRNTQSRPQAEPRLPRGHFDKEGLSQGTRNGEGRSRHDAYNTDGNWAHFLMFWLPL